MAEVTMMSADVRERAGKGEARAQRRMGRVPAVIYGNKQTPISIALDGRQLARQLANPGFFTSVIEIEVDSGKHQVLARDVQFHPVTDRPLHVDFLRFDENTKITVDVPVVFANEEDSPGLKYGGVLNIVRREVELLCSPLNIPQELRFDLTGLEVGDTIHISAVALPDGVTPTVTDRDFTVATIAAPTVLTAAEEAGEVEGEEPELDEDGNVIEPEEGDAAEGDGEDDGDSGDSGDDK